MKNIVIIGAGGFGREVFSRKIPHSHLAKVSLLIIIRNSLRQTLPNLSFGVFYRGSVSKVYS